MLKIAPFLFLDLCAYWILQHRQLALWRIDISALLLSNAPAFGSRHLQTLGMLDVGNRTRPFHASPATLATCIYGQVLPPTWLGLLAVGNDHAMDTAIG
jgi:hypothetical protein